MVKKVRTARARPRAVHSLRRARPRRVIPAACPRPSPRAQVGKYEIGKTLGEGTFGKVKYAVNTETGEKVRLEAGPKGCGVTADVRDVAASGAAAAHYARPPPRASQVAIKILDKEKIQKQNMGAQIKKEASDRPLVSGAGASRRSSVSARPDCMLA
jgi:serine/threonine protein kinase